MKNSIKQKKLKTILIGERAKKPIFKETIYILPLFVTTLFLLLIIPLEKITLEEYLLGIVYLNLTSIFIACISFFVIESIVCIVTIFLNIKNNKLPKSCITINDDVVSINLQNGKTLNVFKNDILSVHSKLSKDLTTGYLYINCKDDLHSSKKIVLPNMLHPDKIELALNSLLSK